MNNPEQAVKIKTKTPTYKKGFSPIELFQKLSLLIILLVLWVLASRLDWVDSLFLPGPEMIYKSYVSLWNVLPTAILTSIFMIIAGFLIGSCFGILSSLLMAYSKLFLNAFGTIFDILRPVPIFALIPMFILWFGIGMSPQIALIALGCSVITGVTTSEAIRNVPSIYIQASYTLGAKRGDIFRTIVWPYIVPHLIGAIRLAAASSIGLDVAAEFMGSQTGLGYLMIVQQQYLKTEGIFAIVLIYSLFAYILDRIIGRIESHFTSWTERRVNKTA